MKRYWYHLSTKLKKDGVFTLVPWGRDKAHNRDNDEPDGERIPVAPSITQCLVALPYYRGAIPNVYRTVNPEEAEPPNGIFDSEITEEHWLTKPTQFGYLGQLFLNDVEDEHPDRIFDWDVCCLNDVNKSRQWLNFLNDIKVERYLIK